MVKTNKIVISILPFHNSTVGVFSSGKCLEYHHEERFTNQKNYFGFPEKCLNYLSKKYDFSNLEAIVIPTKYLLWITTPNYRPTKPSTLGQKIEHISQSNLRNYINYFEYKLRFKSFFFYIRQFIIKYLVSPYAKKEFQLYFLKKYNIKPNQIHFYDHHTCHAWSVINFYNLSKLKTKILIFSTDGAGDGYCAKTFIYNPKKNKLKLLDKIPYDSSIGLLYSEATKFLGMKPSEHEYKVMGLAAYNQEEKYYSYIYNKLKEIIYFDKKKSSFKSKINTNLAYFYYKKHFTGQRFDNIATATQKITQDMIIDWIVHNTKKHKINHIACTGGVFMNVKLNQLIQKHSSIKKLYIIPTPGDESICHGSSHLYYKHKKITSFSDLSLYKGRKYSSTDVYKYLLKHNYFNTYKITKHKDIEKTTANLLSKNKIVARFKGSSEWGARSLCNRSILANSSNLDSFTQVNNTIKMRDFWMPFAPTILDSWAPRYIKGWKGLKNKIFETSKYMITAFDTTTLAQSHLKAAMHQKDKTIRPQILSQSDNPDMYKLLKYYQKLTNMGGLMNTSFNLHGYPLATTLKQALFTFKNSDLKYLTIEDYLIQKQ